MFFKFMKNNPVKKINCIIKKAFQKNRSYYRPTEILPFFDSVSRYLIDITLLGFVKWNIYSSNWMYKHVACLDLHRITHL